LASRGTTEVVPFQNAIDQTGSKLNTRRRRPMHSCLKSPRRQTHFRPPAPNFLDATYPVEVIGISRLAQSSFPDNRNGMPVHLLNVRPKELAAFRAMEVPL
jgi:hypothetical protein